MLIIFLPTTYSLLGSRFYLPASIRDLVVARGSLIFLVLGASTIAMAPTPPFLLLGAGYLLSQRSAPYSLSRLHQPVPDNHFHGLLR